MSNVKVTQENIDHVFHFTDYIVNNFPRRLAGSESCLKAGKAIKEEFEKTCDNGSVGHCYKPWLRCTSHKDAVGWR